MFKDKFVRDETGEVGTYKNELADWAQDIWAVVKCLFFAVLLVLAFIGLQSVMLN